MKFFRDRDVAFPERELEVNAGYDFFVCNTFDEKFISDFKAKNELGILRNEVEITPEKITIEPHGHVNIPSGIHVLMPDNIVLTMSNKSGVALKKNLDVGASIVDSSYEGEIHLNLTNTSDFDVEIKPGDKIVQGIPYYIDMTPSHNIEGITLEEFYAGHTKARGIGMAGSTGEKAKK